MGQRLGASLGQAGRMNIALSDCNASALRRFKAALIALSAGLVYRGNLFVFRPHRTYATAAFRFRQTLQKNVKWRVFKGQRRKLAAEQGQVREHSDPGGPPHQARRFDEINARSN